MQKLVVGFIDCAISEDVAVNIAPGGKVVGIEVLDASTNLGITRSAPKIALENLAAG